jgi:hypothetical protein
LDPSDYYDKLGKFVLIWFMLMRLILAEEQSKLMEKEEQLKKSAPPTQSVPAVVSTSRSSKDRHTRFNKRWYLFISLSSHYINQVKTLWYFKINTKFRPCSIRF